MNAMSAVYYPPVKIKPLSVKELLVGKYYRDILNNRRIRVTEINTRYDVHFLVADCDEDVSFSSLTSQYADGRFYDDGTIEQ